MTDQKSKRLGLSSFRTSLSGEKSSEALRWRWISHFARNDKFKLLLIFSLLILFIPNSVLAFDFNRPNNKFGMHLAQPNTKDIKETAELVNANGGDWGYITLVIQENDRNIEKWQGIFDNLRQLHLIPIIRIATRGEGDNWRRPKPDEANSWVEFLNSLNWVIKNRYIILFNEPNHSQEWGGKVDPEDYGKVALEFAKKLKKKNSDFFVMLAGFDTAAPSQTPEHEDEALFLKKVFSNETIEQWNNLISGWASHSYPADYIGSVYSTGRRSIKTYEWELNLLKELGIKKDLPVFITETGWYNNLGNTANLFEQAFENIWLPDNKVIAVTPFVLNYQSIPFDVFSWVMPGDNDFYSHYFKVQSMKKSLGSPEIIDRGELKFNLPKELVVGSSYHFQVSLKNLGQAIWDKNDSYSLTLDTDEAYFFTDLKDIRPNSESNIDLYMKTPANIKEKDLNIMLVKNKNKVIKKEWKFKVLPLPSVQFSVDLYPKKKNVKEEYEIQFFDTREQLVFKKVIDTENQRGYLDGVQNVSYGDKYRVVILKPNYLPRQQYLVFNKGNNNLKFEMMYPVDFNNDGHFDLADVWALITNPKMLNLFVP